MFFFGAEDGRGDGHVTGVQTCALPISGGLPTKLRQIFLPISPAHRRELVGAPNPTPPKLDWECTPTHAPAPGLVAQIGGASCRERGQISVAEALVYTDWRGCGRRGRRG